MFDLGKLGDLSKLASEAKQVQEKQERLQKEQIDLLKCISGKLDTVIALLQERD